MKNDILTTPTDKLLSPLQPILEEGTEKKNGNQNNYFDMNLLNQNEENKKEEPIMKDLIAEDAFRMF